MTFHIEFTYAVSEREKLMNFLRAEGLGGDGPLQILGAWVAIQTGTGYFVVSTTDTKAIHAFCARWSEYGQVKVTPIALISEL